MLQPIEMLVMLCVNGLMRKVCSIEIPSEYQVFVMCIVNKKTQVNEETGELPGYSLVSHSFAFNHATSFISF